MNGARGDNDHGGRGPGHRPANMLASDPQKWRIVLWAEIQIRRAIAVHQARTPEKWQAILCNNAPQQAQGPRSADSTSTNLQGPRDLAPLGPGAEISNCFLTMLSKHNFRKPVLAGKKAAAFRSPERWGPAPPVLCNELARPCAMWLKETTRPAAVFHRAPQFNRALDRGPCQDARNP